MTVIKDTGQRATLPPFGEEHEELRETVRKFVSKEIAPNVDGWEEAREFPRRLPLVDVRRDLFLDEAADRLTQLLVLLAERRQGGARTGVLDDRQAWLSSPLAGAEALAGACQSSSIV